jgi:hypothetical protein
MVQIKTFCDTTDKDINEWLEECPYRIIDIKYTSVGTADRWRDLILITYEEN